MKDELPPIKFGDYWIRKAEQSDAKEIINCMQSVMDERIYLVSEYYFYTERGEAERLKNTDDLNLLAVLKDEVVGVLTIQRGMYRKTRHTSSLGIAIKQGHRGLGLGKFMINRSIEWCRMNDIKKLNLEVFSSNESAIRLYEKIGFEIEGRKVGQFNIDGKFVDDILMSYKLE
ncbi:MAG: GNAT family N-acetyltransferase [Thermoplasmataceae archaeon]